MTLSEILGRPDLTPAQAFWRRAWGPRREHIAVIVAETDGALLQRTSGAIALLTRDDILATDWEFEPSATA